MDGSRYEITPAQRTGVRALLLIAALWMVGMMTLQYFQAAQNEAGSGFGDGRLRPSLETPGGPYYPAGYERN
jgi:hypothetical protein